MTAPPRRHQRRRRPRRRRPRGRPRRRPPPRRRRRSKAAAKTTAAARRPRARRSRRRRRRRRPSAKKTPAKKAPAKKATRARRPPRRHRPRRPSPRRRRRRRRDPYRSQEGAGEAQAAAKKAPATKTVAKKARRQEDAGQEGTAAKKTAARKTAPRKTAHEGSRQARSLTHHPPVARRMVTHRVAGAPLDFAALRDGVGGARRFRIRGAGRRARAAARITLPDDDATDIPFVTIDPPGAATSTRPCTSLAPADGYFVSYAIADVAVVRVTGGPRLDVETQRRGETLYFPDTRVPLHPPVLSEGAASLLPDQVRPAVLWQITLDATVKRAASTFAARACAARAQLDYAGLQKQMDAGQAPDAIALLEAVGRLRLGSPARVTRSTSTCRSSSSNRTTATWRIALREPLPVEAYNAEISLLTGMCAARLMLDAGCRHPAHRPAAGAGVDRLAEARSARTRRRLAGRCRTRRRARQARPGRTADTSRSSSTRPRCCAAPRTRRSTAPPEQAAACGYRCTVCACHCAAAPTGRSLRQRGVPRGARGAAGPALGPRPAAELPGRDGRRPTTERTRPTAPSST